MYHDKNIVTGAGFEHHILGSLTPHAVLLDDNPDSITAYKDFLLEQGISTLVTSKTTLAKKAYEQHGNSAAYVFDMHMKKIQRVGRRDTARGLAVGVAVINDITNDGKDRKIAHCATLTEYRTEESAEASYNFLKQRGQMVHRLSKHEKFDEFVGFIEQYKKDYLLNIKPRMILNNLNAIDKAFGELSYSEDFSHEVAAIMGYFGANIDLYINSREAVALNSGNDLQDRIDTLAYIKHGILLHFEKDIDDQRAWIHAQRSELGGKSAWECLTSGNIDEMFRVASYVNRVIG